MSKVAAAPWRRERTSSSNSVDRGYEGTVQKEGTEEVEDKKEAVLVQEGVKKPKKKTSKMSEEEEDPGPVVIPLRYKKE